MPINIKHYTSNHTRKQLADSLTLSKHNYGKVLLHSTSQIDKMQKVQLCCLKKRHENNIRCLENKMASS